MKTALFLELLISFIIFQRSSTTYRSTYTEQPNHYSYPFFTYEEATKPNSTLKTYTFTFADYQSANVYLKTNDVQSLSQSSYVTK